MLCFCISVRVKNCIVNTKKNNPKEKSENYGGCDRDKIVQVKNRERVSPEHSQDSRGAQHPYSVIGRHGTPGVLSLDVKKRKHEDESNHEPI